VTKAFFDSNVIISGAGWRTGSPYGCLVAMARRRVQVFTSDWILEEVSRNLKQMMGERLTVADGDHYVDGHALLALKMQVEASRREKPRPKLLPGFCRAIELWSSGGDTPNPEQHGLLAAALPRLPDQ